MGEFIDQPIWTEMNKLLSRIFYLAIETTLSKSHKHMVLVVVVVVVVVRVVRVVLAAPLTFPSFKV